VNSTGQPENSEAGTPGAPTNGEPSSAIGPAALPAAQMLSVDARKVILLGTVGFFLAFLVLLPFWGWLGAHDHRVWLWTALAGGVLGLVSLPLIHKHSAEGRLG
jgi:hypothetical protein